MSKSTQHVGRDDFDEVVLGSDQPVLIDFHADWCPPCRVLGPIVDGVAETYADRAIVGKVDIDANPELAERFEVQSIPTILLFVDGEVDQRFVGLRSEEELNQALDDAIARIAA